jgi:four helix bundle protein
MSGPGYARGFRDLVVYQKARQVSRLVFEVSQGFPREETYSLTSQIRRSSRSVGGQIAEAWAKRRFERHFVSKLTDADAEQQETQHWVETATDCGYLKEAEKEELLGLLAEIGGMLQSMIDRAPEFCTQSPHGVPEDPAAYGPPTDAPLITDFTDD